MSKPEPVDPVAWMTFCGLLADTEDALADFASLPSSDPTRPTVLARFTEARAALLAHVATLCRSASP